MRLNVEIIMRVEHDDDDHEPLQTSTSTSTSIICEDGYLAEDYLNLLKFVPVVPDILMPFCGKNLVLR